MIHSLLDKLRALKADRKREFMLAVIVFLVGSLSFGLGYLAAGAFNHAPIIIEKCSSTVSAD